MRCLTSLSSRLWIILLCICCTLLVLTTVVAADHHTGAAHSPPVAGNYQDDDDSHLLVSAGTQKTKQYAPPTTIGGGRGGQQQQQQRGGGNSEFITSGSSSSRRREGGDTFDGGGGGGGNGGEEKRVILDRTRNEFRGFGDSFRSRRDRDSSSGEEEEAEEQHKFSEFAMGTLNYHQREQRPNRRDIEGAKVEEEEEEEEVEAMMSHRSRWEEEKARYNSKSKEEQQQQSTAMAMGGGGAHFLLGVGGGGGGGEKVRPPPVMDPLTEDEIDDERIFYDIVDSKHLISRLGRMGEDAGRGQSMGNNGLLMGLQLSRSSVQQSQQNQPGGGGGAGAGPSGVGATKGDKSLGGGGVPTTTTTSKATKGGGGTGSGINSDGSCHMDDPHCSEMEAIQSLHKKLDDDANGNIDISESTDFLRQELKYDSGYENRHRVFHFNDDMHISVRELWEAWRRSEVHNWTVEQTTEWLAQSVQLPQYVELFKQHKVTGAYLPRLAVDNMQYLTGVLGIKDHIHKQKIALKAMDVVLFGPPRETGTRWKDYILVTLLLSVIVGCWYGYQQNKNSKTHLRRMAKDMEGLQKAEQALTEMQKELERARLEQENVATEKMDLERRLKETPSLTSSSSDLEVQQLKQEIEMLRRELSRAEIELVDHCWSPPQGLQTWLQLTYELESKSHQAKRRMAEKQLLAAREACEKLKKKRTSLVGAFVSTHGKSIDDVDRSIVEARNSLSEVTHELQERMHRWKQIEQILGFNIVNNNGIAHLESILYSRNNGSALGKLSRANRMSSSQDELDDESVQGRPDSLDRSILEDSSASEENDVGTAAAKFIVGGSVTPTTTAPPTSIPPSILSQQSLQMFNSLPGKAPGNMSMAMFQSRLHAADSLSSLSSSVFDDNRSLSTLGTRGKKGTSTPPSLSGGIGQPPPPPPYQTIVGRTPMPPPRKSLSGGHVGRAQSTDVASSDHGSWPMVSSAGPAAVSSTATTPGSVDEVSHNSSRSVSSSNVVSSTGNKLVHQLSTTSTSTSSNESAPTGPSRNVQGTGGRVVDLVGTSAGTGRTGAETPPSTDSSVVDDEVKKRKRKLHFPFGKKNKNKDKGATTTGK